MVFSWKAVFFAMVLVSPILTSNLVLAQVDDNSNGIDRDTHKSISYTTSNNGVIVVTTQSTCFPIGKNKNNVTDATAFDVVGIQYPVTPIVGQVGLSGISSLSSSKNFATTPIPSGTLTGHYNLETNSTIVHCGISYCKGENCNPERQLNTTNTSVFVNFTKGGCTSPMGVCFGPHTSIDLTISTPSPLMDPGVPYLFKFYLVDSQGKLEEWFFGLEYQPQ